MALSENYNRVSKDGELQAFPVAAATKIYRGALVKISAAGYLAPQAAEVGAFNAGVAYEGMDNSAGAAADLLCRVELVGAFEMNGVAFTQADLGKSVYASDDNTVSVTQASNEILVGKIIEVISATNVLVKLA